MRIAVAGSTGMVGTQLVAAAEAAGHSVVGITRSNGVDINSPAALEEALQGADALVDVTNDANFATAAQFFETVGTNLGDAATKAGVSRTVLLSIIGIELVPEHPYYVAKLAHERAHREHSPGLRILRAAQFLEYPGQAVGWGRDGDTTTVDDMLSQPVDSAEVSRVLLEMATGEREGELVEIAGPKVEQIGDLARKVVARQGNGLALVTREPFEPIKNGALLPGPDAVIAGPTFDEWLEAKPGSID